ncbi:hypothetical protein [Paenibacillus periandrae]|uniref:hypothetical protein n=1 Tax=Paenibacillus periandrae TaxID=1761741 RepID=UPI001F098E8B|nr:hypothetical protein [Paenibacillus periandrae]
MKDWEEALTTFCKLYFNSGMQIDWILVGSVGSVIQGADMNPNDIDIYTKDWVGVEQLAGLLEPFQLDEKSDLPYHDANWLSSKEEPYHTQTFSTGFTWTKGRWRVNSFLLEVVHISESAGIPDSEDGEGIWEGGKYIWNKARYVDFDHIRIPLIPLEIQLESNLRRKRQDRIDAIMHALKAGGLDEELLNKALSTSHYHLVKQLL